MKGCISTYLKINLIYHFFLVLLLSKVSMSIEKNKSEINLVVKGKGNINYLNKKFYLNPSGVIINGVVNYTCKKNCYLDNDFNNITIKFNTSINSCEKMFSELENIIEIDLSNLDTSNVTNMASMFFKCTNLKKIKFGNINTSNVKNMNGTFGNCSLLTSVDVSKFDTSSVTNMWGLFRFCSSLISIDVTNFNTSKVNTMFDMFGYCYNLNFVNVSTFDTSKVKNFQGMFYYCQSLKYLDLSNFNLSSATNINVIISGCRSLVYTNLFSFRKTDSSTVSGYKDTSSKICIKEIDIGAILGNSNKNSNLKFNCSDKCFEKNIKIDLNNDNCIERCNESEYKYEYHNLCYKECPNTTFLSNNKEYDGYLCVDKNEVDSYYYDTKDMAYKECFKTCKICNGAGNETNHNCFECKPGLMLLSDSIYNTNCYEICPFYYYFNEFNNYACTIERKCPEKYNKFIIKNKKCIDECSKDNIFIYEYNNSCYDQCPNGTFLLNNYTCNDILIDEETQVPLKSLNKSSLLIMIKNGLDLTGLDVSELEDEDIILNDENGNIVYTISNTKNQKNNYNNCNMTTVNLDDCEIKLKDEYNISANESLYILKFDIYSEWMKFPKIEYIVYYPLNNSKLSRLNLSICKDTKINISIPINLQISELDKYNASSEYYNDLCNTEKTDTGTDKILNDRRNDFVDNNMSVCEENCKFTDYDNDLKKAVCSCSLKEDVNLLPNDKINGKMILSNFIDINNFANFKLIKCIHLLFDTKNFFNNTANYIIVVILIISVLSIFIFCFHDYLRIKKTINKIIAEKKSVKENKTIHNNPKKRKLNVISFTNSIKDKLMDSGLIKNSNNQNISIANFKNIEKTQKNKSKDKNSKNNNSIQKNNHKSYHSSKNLNNTSKKNKNHKEKSSNPYTEYEMNILDFKEAKLIDKRSYCQYYISLLRTKHLIFFTFCNNKDYNSKIIKIYIFVLDFTINYTFSAMFYSETLMHKIYVESGKFSFLNQLPEMFYALIITSFLNIILKSLGLCQKNILKIKTFDIDNIKKIKSAELKKIKIKIILFFIISYIFIAFFWIYLGCFCAVYKNTQIHLLKEVLSSFFISLVTPFIINIFPPIFRIPSLKKGNSALYKFSQILQII